MNKYDDYYDEDQDDEYEDDYAYERDEDDWYRIITTLIARDKNKAIKENNK